MPASPLPLPLRPAVLAGLVLLLLAGAACGRHALDGYGDRADALRTAARTPPVVNATAGEGYVNVICLAGDSAGRAPYDTLFGCLLKARESGSGTLILPRGMYLGHVSELVTRTLRFHRMEEQFDRFLGYRLVLKFRKVRQTELDAQDDAKNTGMAAHGGGQVAAFLVGLGYVPLTPVVFLVETGLAEQKRRQVADDTRAWGLPEPDRGAVEATWDEYRRNYSRLWEQVTGSPGDRTLDTYVVEECYLERPGRGEVLEVVRRRVAPAPGRSGGS